MENAAGDLNCSKCGKALDADGSPSWCKSCRAKYQREYQIRRHEQSKRNGYAAGAAAMKTAIAERFRLYGNAHFSGIEAAAMITKAPDLE